MERVHEKDIPSVFSVPAGEKGIGWFCAMEIIHKKTKNGKDFMRMKILDMDNNAAWLRVWGKFPHPPEPYTLWVANVHNDSNWGMSTSAYKMKQVTAYDN